MAAEDYFDLGDGLDWKDNSIVSPRMPEVKRKSSVPRTTEEILNADFWVDRDGNKYDLDTIEKDYVRNIMLYLYRKKDYFWLNCSLAKNIEAHDDADSFFKYVIRNSTLWTGLQKQLEKQDIEDFNFEY